MNSSSSGRGESVSYHHCLTELFRSGSHIEFGAEQCKVTHSMTDLCAEKFLIGILVRNEGAREKLREQIGDVGIIM